MPSATTEQHQGSQTVDGESGARPWHQVGWRNHLGRQGDRDPGTRSTGAKTLSAHGMANLSPCIFDSNIPAASRRNHLTQPRAPSVYCDARTTLRTSATVVGGTLVLRHG